ncbi:MAG: hypothetical protein LBT96_04655 [Campylobacteraceae bacterium]|jgi:uncharacterized protein (UPF0128 family)|nr:hypothetical protein [Campylobacteraceae bacterium]
MNKINPLILIPALVLILLATAYSVSHLKDEIQNGNLALSALDSDAKRITFLKRTWNRTNLEERLKVVFSAGTLSDKGKSFEIKATSLTRQQANDMVQRALMEAFKIEKLEIASESSDRASLVLEIAK